MWTKTTTCPTCKGQKFLLVEPPEELRISEDDLVHRPCRTCKGRGVIQSRP